MEKQKITRQNQLRLQAYQNKKSNLEVFGVMYKRNLCKDVIVYSKFWSRFWKQVNSIRLQFIP